MSLKNHFLRVLRGYEAKRIGFSFNGVSGHDIAVSPRNFSMVAAAIDDGRITVSEEEIGRDGASGYYDSKTKHIKIAPHLNKSSRQFDALLIHESVHASFDLMGSKIADLDGETAGYVAQGYYLRNSGFRRDDDLNSLERFGQRSVQTGDGKVDEFWLKELRESISSSPVYQK